MHDRALIRNAAKKIDGRRDQRNHPEHTARAQRLLRFTDAPTGSHGARFEEERALVWVGADERKMHFWRERVSITGERDQGGLPSGGFFAF